MSALHALNRSTVTPANKQRGENFPHALIGGPLLILLILLAYANTLTVPFLFDDVPSLQRNESVKHLSTAFSPPKNGETVAGRPLLNATFALNHALTGILWPGSMSPIF